MKLKFLSCHFHESLLKVNDIKSLRKRNLVNFIMINKDMLETILINKVIQKA